MIVFGDRWGFRTRHVSIPLETLKTPLRILHLSDLHLCTHDRAKIDFVRRVTDQDFDFVFLTGDIAEQDDAECLVPGLLTRTPRLGAFAVMGNHDHWRMRYRDHLREFLGASAGHLARQRDPLEMKANIEANDQWRVLNNEAVTLEDNGRTIVIAGVDDPCTGHGDLQATMRHVKRADVLIGLVHVPTDLASFSQRSFHLVLAGHTHGGQVRLPFFGAIRTQCDLPSRHAAGLHFVERTAVHVSQGLGAGTFIRVRVLCPPTAYIITLGGANKPH
jgi:predicted MPP superfamily phosphohydrolase